MSGLIPTFTMASLGSKIDAFQKAKVKKSFEILSYVGIQCVNFAKKNHTYTDQTGNLTSSIGYAIIYKGNVEKASMMAEESAKLVDQLAAEHKGLGHDMVLVVVAGMEYAAAVESKHYDVITGSSYKAEELMTYMKAELGAGGFT